MEMERYHELGMCKGSRVLEPWLSKRERVANLNYFLLIVTFAIGANMQKKRYRVSVGGT